MTHKILLIEDQTIVREAICSLLNTLPDFEVCASVGSVADALNLLNKINRPELILCDFNLAGETAYQLLEKSRLLSLPPVVLLTSFGHSIEIQKCQQLGAKGFLLKECTLKELEFGLRTVVAGGVYFTQPAPTYPDRGRQHEPNSALTVSEREILKWMATGMTNKQIALTLGKSSETVKVQASQIFKKIGAHSRTHAVMLATQLNLMKPE